MENDKFTDKLIGIFFEIHRDLGPGFPEKIYHNAVKTKFLKGGIKFSSECVLLVKYENMNIGRFRCDLLVEGRVIVEFKSASGFIPKVFERQVLSYLKSSGLKVGLLVNFGNRSCQIRRIMNGY